SLSASRQRHRVSEVLAEGLRLTVAGSFTVFPYVLAAEIIGSLPIAGAGGGLLDTDLGRLMQPAYLGWILCSVFVQTLLYIYAVLRLERLDTASAATSLSVVVRGIPSVLIAYLAYELLVICGLGIAVILLLLVALLFGIIPGVVATLIPLVPTVWISTALAFFVYPAVLERRGPWVSLGRSLQLARSNWGQAALVVSVPAVGLLCAAALQDIVPVMHGLHTVMGSITQHSSQPSAGQLQDMLSNLDAHQAAHRYPLWQAFTVLLSAFAWWYALAVCYAEYKALKRSVPLTGQ
ncbi:MAG: hypothetical protein ACRESC_00625, partial [Gammaproteobacteria bacterium]